MHGMFSPTINLVTDQINNTPNAQGLTASIVDHRRHLRLVRHLRRHVQPELLGQRRTFRFGLLPRPHEQRAATPGRTDSVRLQLFPEPQCFWDIEALNGKRRARTIINPSGVPDSLRIWFGHNQQCFHFAVSLGCNSADGCYFDNVSVGFADVPATTQVSSASAVTTGAIGIDIWQLWNDVPVQRNGWSPRHAGVRYHHCDGQGGINNAPSTGNPSPLRRACRHARDSCFERDIDGDGRRCEHHAS